MSERTQRCPFPPSSPRRPRVEFPECVRQRFNRDWRNGLPQGCCDSDHSSLRHCSLQSSVQPPRPSVCVYHCPTVSAKDLFPFWLGFHRIFLFLELFFRTAKNIHSAVFALRMQMLLHPVVLQGSSSGGKTRASARRK